MRIFFSAGEPSGDLHASHLIRELTRRAPDLVCEGLGGPLMREAGCKLHFQLTDLAVMGFFRVLPLLFRFLRVGLAARRHFREHRPDAVVLVDFPGFNWWIARFAKAEGIPVIYYVAPQLWAWAPWRVSKMRRWVDLVLCTLPFEEAWFRRRGVAAEFVGHPFFDDVATRPLDQHFIASLSDGRSHPASRTLAVLPGSRHHEVTQNFALQLAILEQLTARFPGLRCEVANYKESHRQLCKQMFRASGLHLPIRFHVGRTSELIASADVCLMVSGSVSLEVLARVKPAVVLFRMNRWLYALGRRFMTCKYISLPNLIADRELLPEFVPASHTAATAAAASEILASWLDQGDDYRQTVGDLQALRDKVAHAGATRRAADRILSMLTPGTLPIRRAA